MEIQSEFGVTPLYTNPNLDTQTPGLDHPHSSVPLHQSKGNTEIWKILYTNIRGVQGKKSSLIENLQNENPHMFLLTETLLPTNNNLNITGYTFFGRARGDRKGGGVGFLIRNDIKNKVIPHIETH